MSKVWIFASQLLKIGLFFFKSQLLQIMMGSFFGRGIRHQAKIKNNKKFEKETTKNKMK
jgi:hypothetical protein